MSRRNLTAPANQRQLRVGEVVRHGLADILTKGELRDPAIEGLVISVPEVRMTADLKLATAFVIPLGGEGSDRLVARVALELGVRLVVPLPLPLALYEQDFASEASLAEFRRLLGRAESSYVLPLMRGVTR